MEKGVASDTWRSSLWRWEAGVRVSPEACKQSPQNVPSPERGFKGYFFPPFFLFFSWGWNDSCTRCLVLVLGWLVIEIPVQCELLLLLFFCWCQQNGFSVLDCSFITLDRWCFVFGGFCIESPISSPPSQLFLDLILLLFLVYSLPTPSLSLTSNNSQASQFKPATGRQRLTAFFTIILLSAFFIWNWWNWIDIFFLKLEWTDDHLMFQCASSMPIRNVHYSY